jgi:WD40 repeat protein/tRNA A-37 threonylcarbamoyl transferase component Bud32
VDCLDDNLLAAYLDARLGEADTAALFAHVDGCARCARLLEQVAITQSSVAKRDPAPDVEPTGDASDYDDLLVVDRAHYVIGAELARGGMGRVLTARDRRLARPVAIKELLDRDARLVARFEREVRITARLQHPAIVHVHEAGRWPSGEPFYAMKLVTGRPLDRCIAETTSFAERLRYLPNVVAAVDALAYAHAQRVIHRDLKPSNVLCGEFGETVVIDWGIAKDLDRDDDATDAPDVASASPERTIAGTVLGTPSYMPPEQAAGRSVDARADVYSLGAVLYHVLSGVAPHTAKTLEELLAKVKTDAPAPLATRAPEVPADLIAIVERAMAREPDDRFATAKEMADELKRFQTGQLVTSHRYTPRELIGRWLRRHRAAVAVASIAVAALVAIGGVALWRIVDEKRRANREAAEAIEHSDQALLAQAREALARDPTASLHALAQLSVGSKAWGDARLVAADAAQRGIAVELPGATRAHALAFSPDDRALAVAGDDGRIQLWDVAARTARSLDGHAHPVLDVRFASAGAELVSIDEAGEVRRWNVSSGAGRVTRGEPAQLVQATISPDGERIVVLRVVSSEVDPDEPRRTLDTAHLELWGDGHERVLSGDNCAAWFPDGRSFVFDERGDHTIRRVDVATGARSVIASDVVNVMSLAVDGTHVYAGDLSGRVRDVASATDVPVGHAAPVNALASRDGLVVAATAMVDRSGSGDRAAMLPTLGDRLVTASDGRDEDLVYLRGHAGDVDAVAITARGDRVASAGRDGTIRIWRLPPVERRRSDGTSTTSAAALALDDKILVTTSLGPALDIRDAATGARRRLEITEFPPNVPPPRARVAMKESWIGDRRIIEQRNGPIAEVIELVRSHDGRRLATLDTDNDAVVWDLAANRGRLLARGVELVAIDDDGRRVATATKSGVFVWDAGSGANTTTIDARITALAFARDGALAFAKPDGVVSFRGASSPRDVRGDANLRALAFSPDGKYLVGAGDGHVVWLWDLATGTARTHRDPEPITRLFFAPDGRSIAIATPNAVRVWQLDDDSTIALVGHAGFVVSLAFRRDSGAVLTAGYDRTVRLWDLPSGRSRVLPTFDDVVVFAGYSTDERHVIAVDHGGLVMTLPDDLPLDEAGLRAWLRSVGAAP